MTRAEWSEEALLEAIAKIKAPQINVKVFFLFSLTLLKKKKKKI